MSALRKDFAAGEVAAAHEVETVENVEALMRGIGANARAAAALLANASTEAKNKALTEAAAEIAPARGGDPRRQRGGHRRHAGGRLHQGADRPRHARSRAAGGRGAVA